jgi:superfamily I DNA/RNA helicase
MVSKNKYLGGLKTRFEQSNLSCTTLKRNQQDDTKLELHRLSTMHRAKGPEFDQVIVLLDGSLPLEADEEDNTPDRLIHIISLDS